MESLDEIVVDAESRSATKGVGAMDRMRWAAGAIAVVLAGAWWLVPASSAHAAGGRWTSHGPYGALVSALALDPGAPSTLYAGTGTGWVFGTSNGGARWSVRGQAEQYTINSLIVDP